MTHDDLRAVLVAAAAGSFPPQDGRTRVVAEPVGRAHAVVAFSAHFVVCAPVERAWLDHHLRGADPFTATHSPGFLLALADEVGADVGALDAVLAADGPDPGDAGDVGLREVAAHDDHPRVRRALRYRDEVRVWRTVEGHGHLVVGRGLAGRLEASFEVDPAARDHGMGAALARAARRLASPADPMFTQVSPGNVASLRAVLAAGYRPVCSEVLLPPPTADAPL